MSVDEAVCRVSLLHPQSPTGKGGAGAGGTQSHPWHFSHQQYRSLGSESRSERRSSTPGSILGHHLLLPVRLLNLGGGGIFSSPFLTSGSFYPGNCNSLDSGFLPVLPPHHCAGSLPTSQTHQHGPLWNAPSTPVPQRHRDKGPASSQGVHSCLMGGPIRPSASALASPQKEHLLLAAPLHRCSRTLTLVQAAP